MGYHIAISYCGYGNYSPINTLRDTGKPFFSALNYIHNSTQENDN